VSEMQLRYKSIPSSSGTSFSENGGGLCDGAWIEFTCDAAPLSATGRREMCT